MKEEGSREIETGCTYTNAGIGMQFNRILQLAEHHHSLALPLMVQC